MEKIHQLNLESKRTVLSENRYKIDFLFWRFRWVFGGGNTLLDIGIGDGYTLRTAQAILGLSFVAGIDISRPLVQHARDVGLSVLHADICTARPDRIVNIVTAFDVIEHLDDLDAGLANIHHALRRNGVLIGTVPYRENLYNGMTECPNCRHVFHRGGHVTSFSEDSIRETLAKAGFCIKTCGFVPWCVTGRFRIDQLATWTYRKLGGNPSKLTYYFLAKPC